MKITNPVYAIDHGGYASLRIEINGKPREIYEDQKGTLIRHGVVFVRPKNLSETATLPNGAVCKGCIADTELFHYAVKLILDVRTGRVEEGMIPDVNDIDRQELNELIADLSPLTIPGAPPFLTYWLGQ